METGRLLSDDLILPDDALPGRHPTDSSQILLGLMTLSHKAEAEEENASGEDSLDGVICKGLLRSLLSALHFRDVATVRHARRVAILAVGRSHKVPILQDGQLAESLRLPLCVSFDHRATDGANAARFTREIISYLETPAKFLLD